MLSSNTQIRWKNRFKKFFFPWFLVGAIAFFASSIIPVRAQLPLLPKINLENLNLNQNLDETITSGCVRLDGLCIFEILDQKANLAQRIKFTEQRLKTISRSYFQTVNSQISTYHKTQGTEQTIYVVLGGNQIPVVTMNTKDATRRGVYLEHEAERVAAQIEAGLKKAKEQRQRPFLIRQSKIALAIAIAMLLAYWLNSRWLKRSRQQKQQLTSTTDTETFSSQLDRRKKTNLYKLKHRLLQFSQNAIWVGGIILILGLFPQTRTTQLWIVTLIRIPLRIVLVALITYIFIRLSYVLIDRINSFLNTDSLENNYVFRPEINRRLRLRINTISRLIRGIITCLWICIGIIVALSVIGFNITPLLAGAGILGLAFSFASQSLIKDTLNGFFIILEDQYAVGDIVTIGTSGGMVENLNLRITQLRDAEGRLITIANSQIDNVANHSNGWSRSDLRIPVAYQANIEEVLDIVGQTAIEISEDDLWQEKILESPQILGVEDFSEFGVVIRLFIKTEPLKQWEVAREFRRRIKIAFEAQGIPLSLSQQKIWFHDTHSLSSVENTALPNQSES